MQRASGIICNFYGCCSFMKYFHRVLMLDQQYKILKRSHRKTGNAPGGGRGGLWEAACFSNMSSCSLLCLFLPSPPPTPLPTVRRTVSVASLSILDESLVATSNEGSCYKGGFCDSCFSISPSPPASEDLIMITVSLSLSLSSLRFVPVGRGKHPDAFLPWTGLVPGPLAHLS